MHARLDIGFCEMTTGESLAMIDMGSTSFTRKVAAISSAPLQSYCQAQCPQSTSRRALTN